jgi:hypothetical protein
VAGFSKNIPEQCRITTRLVLDRRHRGQASVDFRMPASRMPEAGQISFHIGDEHRRTETRKSFSQNLQGHGLASPGCARNQPMTIGHDPQLLDDSPIAGADWYCIAHYTIPRIPAIRSVIRPECRIAKCL